jgi:hypothetical protein
LREKGPNFPKKWPVTKYISKVKGQILHTDLKEKRPITTYEKTDGQEKGKSSEIWSQKEPDPIPGRVLKKAHHKVAKDQYCVVFIAIC